MEEETLVPRQAEDEKAAAVRVVVLLAGSPVDTSCGLLWVWSSGAQAWSLSFALGLGFGEEGRALGLSLPVPRRVGRQCRSLEGVVEQWLQLTLVMKS